MFEVMDVWSYVSFMWYFSDSASVSEDISDSIQFNDDDHNDDANDDVDGGHDDTVLYEEHDFGTIYGLNNI